MDFKTKTFRKCGSHYSDLGALDGVEIKIGQQFQPPRKVALPVGFHQNDPSEVLSLTYDFSLENEIISKAEEIKARQLREQQQQQQQQQQQEAKNASASSTDKAVSTASSLSNQSTSISSGQAIFSTVGTDILQPTTCTTVGHKRNDSFGKNPFDLSDFEAQDSNPFELVELQSINDLDELKSLLQPSSQPQGSQSVPVEGRPAVAVNSTKAPTTIATSELNPAAQTSQPFNYLASQTPKDSSVTQPIKANLNSKLSKSVPDLSSNQLVDIPSGENASLKHDSVVNSRSVSPPNPLGGQLSPSSTVPTMGYGMPAQPLSYLHGVPNGSFPSQTARQNDPVLVNVKTSGHTIQASLPSSLPPISTSLTSLMGNKQTVYPMAEGKIQPSSNIRLPPLSIPPPIPPRPTGRKNEPSKFDNVGNSVQSAVSGRVSSGYPETTEEIPASLVSGQEVARPQTQSDGESDLPPKQSFIKRQPAQRRNKSKMDRPRHHSTPLPSIPDSPSPSQASSWSNLPDPTPVLTDSEKRFVDYIGIMGFPKPRIARAVQRIGEKDREVIDFLVAVEKLTEEGFPEDDVEIALSLYDDNDKKALEFLKLSESFKQLGFEEQYIQEALKAADNDHDKALDFLTSISAS